MSDQLFLGNRIQIPFMLQWFFFVLALCLSACSSDPTNQANTDYSSDPKGLQVDVNSSANLNAKSDIPSTLAVTFIQASDAKALVKLSQNKTELDKFLMGEPTENPLIISTDRYIIQPAARDSITMARRQDAKAVLIYAGYFKTPLVKCVRILEFPVPAANKGFFGGGSDPASPTPLYLFLNLADTYIDRLSILGPDDLTFPDADNEALQGGAINAMPKGDGRVQPL